ncbi:bifunctional 4-hydroxy-2-oxoglutarate aldolase/2-dehydro-3-deoxy-phosphogluconate aldolase [Gracilibacillus alcaliphilus]|uniref:bifunctional 4-hydroxy-2-oxoglutarate aldolase/2-dehydro-3-deoxy-phosphogluconate aldolase n=1 Tax=Gracilibacillus alcaliphilus TaxID=1401441 RepID=UPI001958225A|nr:bifunctional 4-hydroxy-2-oxoglutarate aldolase/2-dehydro-3-deoxy-phosphogluconate aldolase [Gracilibacillus alcaliphilus]MBM7679044.1 2-dehydro-3-deoxyphosphogluconate aldolase/(4S)-4-hydroxy-2-oxoglutarate aldolase [Gracilibacillus alcaliphilus]
MSIIEGIKQEKVVAVIRKANQDNIVPILEALADGGVHHVEITAETPHVTQLIEKAVKEVSTSIKVGAGTVLDAETARTVMMAGAAFVVSPTWNLDTLRLCQRYGVEHIPGVLTPTEISTAYEHGARMVKIFPADAVGPNYIKNIRGPLPHVTAMVTGGITLDNMQDYLKAGSSAVGIGSNLVDALTLKTTADYQELTNKAKAYRQQADLIDKQ